MVAGPALANPVHHGRWVQTLIDGARRDLGMVTIHRYPYTGCPGRRGTRSYATIGRVLSPAASTGMAASLRPLVDDAHDAGLPLRLTELNSVNCGGRPGVSDAFATALWAPDALFSLLRAGVDGVNLHVRAAAINSPFALGPGGLQARPLLYGLILFARTLGPDAQLVTLRSHLSRPRTSRRGRSGWGATLSTSCSSTRAAAPSGCRCGCRRAAGPVCSGCSPRRPPRGRASPSVAAHSAPMGAGRACRRARSLTPRSGAYAVSVHGMSAALITVRVRPGALGVAALLMADDGVGHVALLAGARSPRR